MERLTHFGNGEYSLNYGVGIHEATQRLGRLERENAAIMKELKQRRNICNRLYEYVKTLKEEAKSGIL